MIEEELRKEATTTVEWECTPMIDRPTFVNGYVTGSKPREQRIAELEAKIEKMKLCANCKHCGVSGWCHKLGRYLLDKSNQRCGNWEIKEDG